jgi:hypothetical protein
MQSGQFSPLFAQPEVVYPVPKLEVPVTVGLAIALGGYLGFALGHAREGMCLMAVPGPTYYATAFLGVFCSASFSAVALWRAVVANVRFGPQGRGLGLVWLVAGAESFGVAAYIMSTISISAMCAVWPFV